MLISNSFLALAAVVPASATALETTTALDLAAGVDGDGAGPLAVAAAVLRQPTAYGARDSAPSPHKNADLGALTLKQRQAEGVCPDSCPPGFAGLCDGEPVGPVTCGDDCCVGQYACTKFTGCVKTDGSCVGPYACDYAKIPMVENSCKGDQTCKGIGQYVDGGVVIGHMTDSCNGHKACQYGMREGKVGTVTGSCNGHHACRQFATYGTVGSITASCNGSEACKNLAFGGSARVGSVTKSCNRDNACADVAFEAHIESITKTCNNEKHKPCANVDLYEGTFGDMVNFVHAETGEKHTRDSIDSILGCMNACHDSEECNGIKWKGHTARPCRFFGGVISDYPCNGKNVCITALPL